MNELQKLRARGELGVHCVWSLALLDEEDTKIQR